MTKYVIIGAEKITSLTAQVNVLVGEGWKPTGGPFVEGWVTKTYYQALFKDVIIAREKDIQPMTHRSKN